MLVPSAAAKGWKLVYELPHTDAIPDIDVFRSRKAKNDGFLHCLAELPQSATVETTIENALRR